MAPGRVNSEYYDFDVPSHPAPPADQVLDMDGPESAAGRKTEAV